jgi:hypothetical protein
MKVTISIVCSYLTCGLKSSQIDHQFSKIHNKYSFFLMTCMKPKVLKFTALGS